MPTTAPNFNFLALIVSEIKRVPKNLMWDYYPLPYPYIKTFMCVPSTWQVLGKIKQPAKFQHRISMHHAVMRICIPHRLSIMSPKMVFLGVLRVRMWKYCVLTPKRHYPAWIRVCWCIECQNRINCLSSRSVERFCVQRNKKNWLVTLSIWGEVTPGAILKTCGLWGIWWT